jgi:hypothetical protein
VWCTDSVQRYKQVADSPAAPGCYLRRMTLPLRRLHAASSESVGAGRTRGAGGARCAGSRQLRARVRACCTLRRKDTPRCSSSRRASGEGAGMLHPRRKDTPRCSGSRRASGALHPAAQGRPPLLRLQAGFGRGCGRAAYAATGGPRCAGSKRLRARVRAHCGAGWARYTQATLSQRRGTYIHLTKQALD